MNANDRRLLTEKMGECWHDIYWHDLRGSVCKICDQEIAPFTLRTFTTWDDAWAVWEWANRQEWWDRFWDWYYNMTDEQYQDSTKYFTDLVVQFGKEILKWQEASNGQE